jgi:FlaG/FlaF family flagellin (archaellin)
MTRRVLLGFAVPVAAGLLGMQFGCATARSWTTRSTPMNSAAEVPAGQGTVKATLGNNGNTNLAIRVKHLAPAFKVQADATVYVVWLQQTGQNPQNIGALALNSDLEGSLDTVTPFRKFTITVTPEPGRQVEQATHPPVFTSEVNRIN